MRRRRRTILIDGEKRLVSPEQAARFEVVRGALLGDITLMEGARRLRVPVREVVRLVEGARRAVIAALGEDALLAAQRPAHLAAS